MKKHRSKRANAALGFLPFVILCVVPIVSMLVVRSYYSRSLYKQVCTLTAYEEQMVANTVSGIITDIRSTYAAMLDERYQTGVERYISGGATYKSTAAIIEKLKESRESSTAVESMYIYIRDRDVVLSNYGVTDSRLFFLANFGETDFTYDEWIESIEKSDNTGDFAELSGEGSDRVNYSMKYGASDFGDNLIFGAIVDKTAFFANVEPSKWRTGCGTYIFNGKNEIIFRNVGKDYKEKHRVETEKDFDTLGRHTVVLQTFIPLRSGTGYRMYTVIPKNIHMQSMRKTTLVATFLVIASVILTLLILVWIAKKNYTPILDAVRLLGGGDMKMEYAFITDSIKNLIESNDRLTERISYRQDNFRDVILGKLIHNELNDEMRFLLKEYGVDFEFEFFAALIFKLCTISGEVSGSVDREMRKAVEVAFTDEKNRAYVFEHNDRFVCIINTDNAAGEYAQSIARIAVYCASMLKSKFYFDVQMGISDIHRGVENISLSYFEAIEALCSEKKASDTFVKLYGDVADVNVKYLSLDSEDKILSSIREGNAERALHELEKVFAMLNTGEPAATQYIEYDLICMMLKLSQTVDAKGDDALKSKLRFSYFANVIGSTAALERKITELVEELCDLINRGRNSKVRDVIQIGIDYIENHYPDTSLSVKSICTYLGMSEVHFTTLFKRTEGTTPGEYINRYRIERAKELLSETDMNIQAVTNAVGYLSTRTFDRVFKKYTGKTPKEYRDAAKTT